MIIYISFVYKLNGTVAMQNDDFKEAWNLLVEDYCKNKSEQENVVQGLWEDYLCDAELFGYSKAKKEIQAQVSIPLGSSERLIPDILVKRGEKNLFLVELKRYDSAKTEAFEKQLRSYMMNSEIRCSVGILVCQNLTVCFDDFASAKKLEIPFEKDNPMGIKFVELFSKREFETSRVEEFIDRGIQEGERRKEISEKLRESGFLESCVAGYFQKSYSPAMVKEVLSRYDFDCRPKSVGGGAATGNVRIAPVGSLPSAKVPQVSGNGRDKLGKNRAKNLALKNGCAVSKAYTYSATNKTSRRFWSNPNVDCLDDDWWFLCDDLDRKVLNVFFIPKGSLQAKGEGEDPGVKDGGLLRRSDSPTKLELLINPKTLEDERGKVSFRRFLKKKIPY